MKTLQIFSLIFLLPISLWAQVSPEVEEVLIEKPNQKKVAPIPSNEIIPSDSLIPKKDITLEKQTFKSNDSIAVKGSSDSIISKFDPHFQSIQQNTPTQVVQIQNIHSPQIVSQQKSLGLALGASLILPGMGEYYLGSSQQGRVFLWSDVALWSAFFVSQHLKTTTLRSARTYAVQHAHAQGIPLEEDILQKMAEYRSSWGITGLNINPDNTEDYRQAQLRAGVSPSDLYTQDQAHFWDWGGSEVPENNQHFKRYQSLMGSYRTTKIFWQASAGLLILNRVLSVVNVLHTYRQQKAYELTAQVNPLNRQLFLSWNHSF